MTHLADISHWRLITPEIVSLAAEHFDRAAAVSQPVVGESHQWQTYLQSLALDGFQHWLTERGEALALDYRRCSLGDRPIASVLDGVYHLSIPPFRLMLIAV
ncbi:MAG: DUF1822 family protein, partial [Cyanobacteria bacterium P01_H01_bin.119]